MKKLTLFLALTTLLISCEKEGALTKNNSNTIEIPQSAILKYSGNFVPTSGISVSGSAKIYSQNGLNFLKLNDFSVSSGPDLKVYLSKTNAPNQIVNLGGLLSAQNLYYIPDGVVLSDYKFVLIHCQQYNHLFAIAQLTNN